MSIPSLGHVPEHMWIPELAKYLEFRLAGKGCYIATYFVIREDTQVVRMWWTNSLN